VQRYGKVFELQKHASIPIQTTNRHYSAHILISWLPHARCRHDWSILLKLNNNSDGPITIIFHITSPQINNILIFIAEQSINKQCSRISLIIRRRYWIQIATVWRRNKTLLIMEHRTNSRVYEIKMAALQTIEIGHK
jgi:hypothetical protein